MRLSKYLIIIIFFLEYRIKEIIFFYIFHDQTIYIFQIFIIDIYSFCINNKNFIPLND